MSTAEELKNVLNTIMKEDVVRLGSDYQNEFWSTGILPMDAVLDGGFAKGRMALLAGESATLKSMIGLTTAAQVQKGGGVAALIDTEHAFNPDWAKKVGVDVDSLIVSRPDTGESAIDQMEVLVRNDIDYICMDSIAALLPRAERDIMLSGKDHVQPARIAALMAIGLRRLNTANEKTTIVWISQLRDNLGAMAFAPKNVITGGKSIHYYVSQSLMLRKVGKLTADMHYFDGEKDVPDKQVVGQKFRAELSKSRTGQPFRIQHFNYDLNSGEIDVVGYLIQQGLDMDIIHKSGAMWDLTLVDPATGEVQYEKKARGKDKFRELLETDLDTLDELNYAVARKYGLNPDTYTTWRNEDDTATEDDE